MRALLLACLVFLAPPAALAQVLSLGPDGRVRDRHIGSRDWSDGRARKTIEGLMTKPPLQTAVAY